MANAYTGANGQATVPVTFLAAGTGTINLVAAGLADDVSFTVTATTVCTPITGCTTRQVCPTSTPCVLTNQFALNFTPAANAAGQVSTISVPSSLGVTVTQPAAANSAGATSFSLTGLSGTVVPVTTSWTSCGQSYNITQNVTL